MHQDEGVSAFAQQPEGFNAFRTEGNLWELTYLRLLFADGFVLPMASGTDDETSFTATFSLFDTTARFDLFAAPADSSTMLVGFMCTALC